MFTDECACSGDVAGKETAQRGPGCERHPPAVLIVEDERVARKALGALLSASGFPTRGAESAEEALDLLDRQPAPRVALVDLNLPGMSGLEFIRHLQRRSPDVHTVLMTGAGDDALARSEEHTSELQSPYDLVCRLLLEKKKQKKQLSPLRPPRPGRTEYAAAPTPTTEARAPRRIPHPTAALYVSLAYTSSGDRPPSHTA